MLLEAFESTQGSLGQRVLNPKRKPGQKAAHQLQGSWTHWTKGLTVQEVCAKCTMIQIETMLPLPCRSYVQARNSTTVQGLVRNIEKFFSEQNSSWDDPRWHQQRVPTHRRFGSHQQQSNHQQPQEQQPNNHQGQQPNNHQGQQPNRQGQQKASKDTSASPQPGSKDSHSFQTPRPHRINRDQVRCKLGHYAQNCPDAVPRISRLSRARQVYITVNTAQMKAVLDSGAEMSVVPAHMVPPSAYTGDKLKAAGVWEKVPYHWQSLLLVLRREASPCWYWYVRDYRRYSLVKIFPTLLTSCVQACLPLHQPPVCLDLYLTKQHL